jgi:hypothetical protein
MTIQLHREPSYGAAAPSSKSEATTPTLESREDDLADFAFEEDEAGAGAAMSAAPVAEAMPFAQSRARTSSAPSPSRKQAKPKSAAPKDAAAPMGDREDTQLEGLRSRAEAKADAALAQTQLDEETRALFAQATAYVNSPTGSSPVNDLLALAGNPNTPDSLKPQIWFLLGDIYRDQARADLARQAYTTAIGL